MKAVTVYAAKDGEVFSSQEDADQYDKEGCTYRMVGKGRGKVYPSKMKTDGEVKVYLAKDGTLFEAKEETEEYEKSGCHIFKAFNMVGKLYNTRGIL